MRLTAMALICAAAALAAPLHEAAIRGDLPNLNRRISAGDDVNARANNGLTALHLAGYLGHRDIVNSLLAAEAEVDVRANDGATPLMLAAQNGHQLIVDSLLADTCRKEQRHHPPNGSCLEGARGHCQFASGCRGRRQCCQR